MKTKSEALRAVAEVDHFFCFAGDLIASLGLSGPSKVDYWQAVCRYLISAYKEHSIPVMEPDESVIDEVFYRGRHLCRSLFNLCDALYESEQTFAGAVIRTASEKLYEAMPPAPERDDAGEPVLPQEADNEDEE